MSKTPVYFEVHPFPVSIGVLTSEKQLRTEAKRLGMREGLSSLSWQQYGGRVVRLDNVETDVTLIFVMIDAKNMADESVATRINIYSHEATHVYQFLMDAIGEDEPGAEIEAYTIGFITEQIYTILEKSIGKSK